MMKKKMIAAGFLWMIPAFFPAGASSAGDGKTTAVLSTDVVITPGREVLCRAVPAQRVVPHHGGLSEKAPGTGKADNPVTGMGIVGHLRATPSSRGNIVQIVWTGVEVPDPGKSPKAEKGKTKAPSPGGKKRKNLEKPLLSTFQDRKTLLPAGTVVELVGDTSQIERAALLVINGSDPGEERGLTQNPSDRSRRVYDLGTDSSSKTSRSTDSGENAATTENGTSGTGTRESAYPSSSHSTSSPSSSGSGYGRAENRSSRGKGSGLWSSSHGPSLSRGDHRSDTNRDGSSRTQASVRDTGLKEKGIPDSKPRDIPDSTGKLPGSRHKPVDGNHGTGSISLDQKARSDNPVDGRYPDAHTGTLHTENPVPENGISVSSVEGETEGIDTEITDRGCKPRIDLDGKRVVMQKRVIYRKGDKIIRESPCLDTSERYAIRKDYHDCADEVDHDRRLAWSTFRRYWKDGEGTVQWLDDKPVRDERTAFSFQESPCEHETDIGARTAWRRVETFYLDRNNSRKVVKSCHRSGNPIPLMETAKGCSPAHHFEKKHSVIRKRLMFMDGGVEHEVLSCRPTEEVTPHVFVKDNCKPVTRDKMAIPMVKRQIEVDGKRHMITKDCEPLPGIALEKQVCEGQFEHDMNSSRSWEKVRWFYTWNGRKRFVNDACIRGEQFFEHHIRTIGYKNHDNLVASQPTYMIFIRQGSTMTPVTTIEEKDPKKFVPYSFQKNVYNWSKSTDVRTLALRGIFVDEENFYNKTEHWLRPDNTVYMKLTPDAWTGYKKKNPFRSSPGDRFWCPTEVVTHLPGATPPPLTIIPNYSGSYDSGGSGGGGKGGGNW